MKAEISIRLATPADAKEILEIYQPIVLETAISFELESPSEAEMAQRIEKITEQYPWLVAVDKSSKIIGYAYASPHRERMAYQWSVDVSAYVRADSKGSGVGTLLYKKLFELLKKQNYFRAFAGIALPNTASVALHEKMGFRKIGTYENVGFKFKKWHDVGWWELTIQAPVSNPAVPTKIKEIS